MKKRIGILVCGHLPDNLEAEFGDYHRLYTRMLGEDAFDYQAWNVVDNDFPDGIDAADGYLISGSRHGAYEALDWIPPLEQFIRDCHAADKALVGICFGHQIIAQALGGRVEKFAGGWSTGRVEYTLDAELGETPVPLYAFHQDQVVEAPPGARVLGHSDVCRYAALGYGDTALSLQPHPEFSAAFMHALLRDRGFLLPDDVRERAETSIDAGAVWEPVAAAFRTFFQRSGSAR